MHTNSNNQTRKANTSTSAHIANNSITHPSHLSQLSQTSQHLLTNVTREIVEEFFYDDGGPYRPPTPHTLDESPCKSIIRITQDDFYYCSMHRDIQNIYLESIEHHIKFKDPEIHKSEILKLLDIQNSIR